MSEGEQQQFDSVQEGEQVDYARWQRELQYAVGSEELLVELLHATNLYRELRLGEKSDANNRIIINERVWWLMVLLSPSCTNSETYERLPEITIRTSEEAILVIVALVHYERKMRNRMTREIEVGKNLLCSICVQQADYARLYGSLYRTDKVEFTMSRFECIIVPGTYITALHYELTHWLRILCEYRLKTNGEWSDDQSQRCESLQIPLFENDTPPTHPVSLPTKFGSSSSIEMQVASEPDIHPFSSSNNPSLLTSDGNFKRFSPSLSPPSVSEIGSSSEPPTSNKHPFEDYTFYPVDVDLNMMFDKINELKKELHLLKPMLDNDEVRSRLSNNSLEELRFEIQRQGGAAVTSDSIDEVSDLPDDELESSELQLQETQ